VDAPKPVEMGDVCEYREFPLCCSPGLLRAWASIGGNVTSETVSAISCRSGPRKPRQPGALLRSWRKNKGKMKLGWAYCYLFFVMKLMTSSPSLVRLMWARFH
jgi:hypothetical protein